MRRLTAYVSGKVQKVGYRARVIDIARAFGIKGIIENLNDGRVKIIAEGDDEKIKWFESAIDIKNTLIQVSSIEKRYTEADGEFSGFYKVVADGETDSRLDKGVEIMTKMLVAIENVNKTLIDMNSNLGGKMDLMIKAQDGLGYKMDQMLDKQDVMIEKQDVMIEKQDLMISKQDVMIEKQDQMISKQDVMIQKQDRMLSGQDELLVEVKDMNRNLNKKADQLIKKQDDLVRSDIAEIKTALKAKGIM